jgi:hypothetical protein
MAVQAVAEELGRSDFATVPVLDATLSHPDFRFIDQGIHPDAAGHRFIASLVQPAFHELLD